ncbi:MAG TPA: L-rhamnose isomerase [Firmicutes bacterium]|nr:L-rhamnose isomerase [Bacillota bacterium]
MSLERIKAKLRSLEIETPSWGYSDSGTRFKVFHQLGAATTVEQRIDDAYQVHRHTGIAPSVALHIPWDMVDDWQALKEYAEDKGMKIGAINPNLFQENEYKLGSLAHTNPQVQKKAIDHVLECVDIMKNTDSEILSLWLADGTNYPGQGDFVARKRALEDSLSQIYQSLEPDMTMLIEYKFFEPAFYHTDIADWGMATTFANKLGEQAKTLVDLGHHPMGTNIEHIVAFLLDEEKLGGFHFNNRKYADDDLTTGSINPYELFLIFLELVKGEDRYPGLKIAYMIDQAHNVKHKIEAMIQSVVNIQEAYAKALLVDRQSLEEAQQNFDIVGAEEILLAAYKTDVRPLLAQIREEMGVPTDPLAAYRNSGHKELVAQQRG